ELCKREDPEHRTIPEDRRHQRGRAGNEPRRDGGHQQSTAHPPVDAAHEAGKDVSIAVSRQRIAVSVDSIVCRHRLNTPAEIVRRSVPQRQVSSNPDAGPVISWHLELYTPGWTCA